MNPAAIENPPVPDIDPTLVALGGEEISVTYRDGRSARIKVRILEIEQFSGFIDRLRSERLCAEFVCAQPAGWASTLTPDSVQDIVEKADALNFTRALRWIERRAKIMARLAPATAVAERLPSRASSPSANSAPASA